jgi:arabinan endo-1,5-alpha-L-arabinosidase
MRLRRIALLLALVVLVSCQGGEPAAHPTSDAHTSPGATGSTATGPSASGAVPSVMPTREPPPPGEAYRNPVFDHEAPDPAVMRDADGTFYVYTTQSHYGGQLVHVPVLRSSDLVHWTFLGDAMPTFPRWGGGDTWAPHVFAREDGRYVLYVSVTSKALGIMQVATAVAQRPDGPFEPTGRPFLGLADETIDPFVLRTSDGGLFFYWSVDNSIRVRRLAEDGLSLSGPDQLVLDHVGEEGTGYDSVVEGAWVTEHAGAFYLFSSGDICCGEDAHYAVSVSRSDSPEGPFERNAANPVLQAGYGFFAPGHNSVATDDAGNDWIVYHAMPEGTRTFGRIMLIDRIRWVDGWPVVNDVGAPSSDARRRPVIEGS